MRTIVAGALLGLGLVGTITCGGKEPLSNGLATSTGTAGKVGSTGAAGTSAAAGTTGLAGTSAAAGVSGPGPGGPGGVGQAGTTGPAGVGGPAGSGVPPGACAGSPQGSATLPGGKCIAGAYPRNGACMCQPSSPNACGNGCVDLLTDDNNCGGCGCACGPTSTCNDGKCGPPPFEVIPAAPGCQSIDVASDSGKLYWADRGHGRVASGPVQAVGTSIAEGESSPTHVTVDVAGKSVYWLTPRAIRRSRLGAAATTVVTAADDIHGFVVSEDGASVYYSTGTNVMRVAATGIGMPEVVAIEAHLGIPSALSISGNRLAYPTNLNGDVDVITLVAGKIASCGIEDGSGNLLNVNCDRVARSQGSLFLDTIIARPGFVLWIDGTTVKKADLTPGALVSNDSVASTLEQNITGMATAANMVYFSEGDATFGNTSSGVIDRSAIARDQTPIRIARGQAAPRSVAVDAALVYWSTANCNIMATGL